MSTPPRSTPAQQGPPANLVALPATAPRGGPWFREHGERAGLGAGCWYYASLPADPTRGGRFDLPDPDGTCYFADAAIVAAMERVGAFTAKRMPVPADIVTGRVVSEVDASSLPANAGNLLAGTAGTAFGVTGELFTMEDYSVPQKWARVSFAAGHAALIYTPRFSPSGQAIAVFGAGGPQLQETSGLQDLAKVLIAHGVKLEPIPHTRGMRFVKAP